MSKPDLHEFRWVEMYTDSKGRTSPGKFIGLWGCIISLVVFLMCGVAIFTRFGDSANIGNLSIQAVAMFGVSSALLAIRRFSKDKEPDYNDDIQS